MSQFSFLDIFIQKKVIKCHETSLSLGSQNFQILEYSLYNRKTEDKNYADKTLRRILPRGLCVIKIDGTVVHIVTGIVKFGYNGDYEKESSSEISTKQYTEKENGQCGHVSAFSYNGEQYFVFGSKMVHLITRASHLQQDIDSYSDKKRYTVAINIANLFITKYSHAIDNVYTFCYLHKVTLCCEAIFPDDQHIVDYKGDSSLFFFAITCPIDENAPLTWCNPIDARRHFQEMGLDVIARVVSATPSEWENRAEDFRNATNSEGAVVYCLDGDGNVIFIYKDKNHHYVFWRAVREQLRDRSNPEIFLKRLRNPQFKNLPDIETLIVKAMQFRAFFFRLSQEERSRFFTRWNDYYTLFDQLSPEDKEALMLPRRPVCAELPSDNLIVTIIIGIPGTGKSTLAAMLSTISSGINLERDMFYGSSDPEKEYHAAIRRYASDQTCNHLVLAKVNHTVSMRQEARDILNEVGRPYQIYYVEFEHRPADFYVERITFRGSSHPSLQPSEKTRGIIFRFLKEAKANPLTDEEELTALRIDPENSKEDNFRQVVDFFVSKRIMDIELNDETIDVALKNVAAYEESNLKIALSISEKSKPTKTTKTTKPLYDALVLQASDVLKIQPMIETALVGKECKSEFHMTVTFYTKDKPVRTDLIFGEEVPINIVGYASDEKATALILEKSEHFARLQVQAEIPHITFALADGVKPFYSNELIKQCVAEDTVHMFDEPVTLVGIVTRF